jgi:hypothetical protein
MSYPHDDAEDQVIGRALDADDTNDTAEAAMDRATLDEYQRVLSYLPFEEIAPPAALEDRVVAAALASRPASVRSITGARRRKTARWVTLGAAVAAAAAVIMFMFASTGDHKPTPGGRVDLAAAGREANVVHPILAAPGTRQAPLRANKTTVGEAALSTKGQGVLYDLMLESPATGEHYWVWLVTKDKVVRIGELPEVGDTVRFTVNGDPSAVTGVSISLEQGDSLPSTPSPGSVAQANF